jgi:hypothetical protein
MEFDLKCQNVKRLKIDKPFHLLKKLHKTLNIKPHEGKRKEKG